MQSLGSPQLRGSAGNLGDAFGDQIMVVWVVDGTQECPVCGFPMMGFGEWEGCA